MAASGFAEPGRSSPGRSVRTPAPQWLPAGWPCSQHSELVRVGGLDMHLQRIGQGPPVLCLHGTGASTHTWRHLAPLLAERFTLVAIDLPGHGFSTAPARGQYSMRAMAQTVAAVLEALGLQPEIAIGHSAGAALACRLALDELLPLRGIAAVNPALLAPRGLQGLVFNAAARGMVMAPFVAPLVAGRAARPGAVERLLASIGSRIDAEGVQQYRYLFRDAGRVAAVIRMMSEWDLASLDAELGRLDVSMLVVSGASDGAVPMREIRSLCRRVPGASLVVLDGIGHLAHEEAPQQVAAEIGRWADALAGTRRGGTFPDTRQATS